MFAFPEGYRGLLVTPIVYYTISELMIFSSAHAQQYNSQPHLKCATVLYRMNTSGRTANSTKALSGI